METMKPRLLELNTDALRRVLMTMLWLDRLTCLEVGLSVFRLLWTFHILALGYFAREPGLTTTKVNNIFSLVHAHFKNRPHCYSNHYTDKPHHLPSQSRLFQTPGKVNNLSAVVWLHWLFLFFVYLFNFGCSWTTCSHAWADKRKSFGRVKRYIRCMRKQQKLRQLFALIANECPQSDFLIFFLQFQVFAEHLEHPEYPPRLGRGSSMKSLVFPRIINIYDAILWRNIRKHSFIKNFWCNMIFDNHYRFVKLLQNRSSESSRLLFA